MQWLFLWCQPWWLSGTWLPIRIWPSVGRSINETFSEAVPHHGWGRWPVVLWRACETFTSFNCHALTTWFRVVREPEMQDWLALKPEEKKSYQLTDKVSNAINRYFFHHYCEHFRRGAFARANSSMCVVINYAALVNWSVQSPMLNMCGMQFDSFGGYW